MKKLLGLLLTLAMLLSGLCAFAEEAGLTKDIVVLYTSDAHCGISSGFGYAGVAAVRDYMAKDNHVVLVDDGDAVQGEPVGTMTTGAGLVDLMNAVGYDIAIPGNHEFDYGMDRFFELVERANYPYISANFNKAGELVLDPYIIKEFDGVKVAFVGATTPKTITSSTPKYFQDENGEFIYGFMQGTDGTKFYEAIQSAVDAARAEGAEIVILMAHLGNEASCMPYTYADLIANTNGINAVLDGHSHDADQVEMLNKDGETVLRTACGTKLEGIGMLRIAKDGTLSTDLLYWGNEIAAPELLGVTNDASAAVDAANAALDAELNAVVASTQVELTINDPVATTEDGKPIRLIRSCETNLGDLCADAYRIQAGSDVAFVNGGGIRVSISAGDITKGQVLKVHPYGNALCVVEATGQEIIDALEWGARAIPSENGGFLQVSGLSYEIDVAVESTVIADENGLFAGVAGERRVKNVKVAGEDIDLEKTYTVACHDYLLKNAGDGFTMFQDNVLLQDCAKLDNQVLIDYIIETLGGVVGEAYADPYGEGRITIING